MHTDNPIILKNDSMEIFRTFPIVTDVYPSYNNPPN